MFQPSVSTAASAWQEIHLLLTALSPISHHDAGVGDTGNVMTFNRRLQPLSTLTDAPPITPAQREAFCAAHPVPAEVWEPLRYITFEQFVAVALIKALIAHYNSREGTGLFSGVERYEMLERRLISAAVQASTLERLWAGLCHGLALPLHSERLDAPLLRFWALPPSVQRAAVAACITQAVSIITCARQWAAQEKLRSAEYAAAVGQLDFLDAPLVTPDYSQPLAGDDAQQPKASVPVISGNTIRHQVVRGPLWQHLVRSIGVPVDFPGQGVLPLGASAIFENGGNIRAGVKQPNGVFALAGRIRRAFPALDLLGGVTDSFDLGESNLKVFAHLVCRENRRALAQWPEVAALPMAQVSAFDLLDQVTEVRQASRDGLGQMIRSFEVLMPGTQIHVRLALMPWATALTRGAVACALRAYEQGLSVVGGQSARGYGEMQVEYLRNLPTAQEDATLFEEYLATNKEQMLGWLKTGTLGTDKVICS